MPISVPNTGWIKSGTVVQLKTGTDTVAIGATSMDGSEKQRVVGDVRFEGNTDVTGARGVVLARQASDTAPASNTGQLYEKAVTGRDELFYYGAGTGAAVQITDNGSVNGGGGGSTTGTVNLTWTVNDDVSAGTAEDGAVVVQSADDSGDTNSAFAATCTLVAGTTGAPRFAVQLDDDGTDVSTRLVLGVSASATPQAGYVMSSDGLGANITGVSTHVLGGAGTGTGDGGNVSLWVAPAGLAGSTVNAHAEALRVTSTPGVLTIPSPTNDSIVLTATAPGTLYSESVVIGSGAITTANEGIAIGYNATSVATGSMAIGHTATTTGTNCLTLGNGATTGTGHTNLACGTSAATTGNSCLAFGTSASAAQGAVAVGSLATAPGTSGVAVGNQATALSGVGRGIAIGSSSSAGRDSIAIGNSATASGNFEMIIGSSGTQGLQLFYWNAKTDANPYATMFVGASGGLGTDINGMNVNYRPGIPTGAGTSALIFDVPLVAGSSSTPQSLSEACRFDGGGGAVRWGMFGGTPAAKGTVTGSRAGNAALASLLTVLAAHGILTDSSS